MLFFRTILLASGLLVTALSALAGAIYRCEGDGPKTLVDSPMRCAGGRATRIGGSDSAPPPPAPVTVREPTEGPERISKRERQREPFAAESFRHRLAGPGAAPTQETPAPVATVSQVPRVPVMPTTAGTVCSPLRNNATALRKCLAEERRKEVRIIANGRLRQVSAAAAELAHYARTRDGLLAIGRSGRPPAWCEELLGDLLQQRRLEVIDNEDSPTPAWIRSSGTDLRGGEVLDPDYTELDAPGGLVASGYVTVRWKQQHTLVVRTRPGCFPAGPNSTKATCGSQRYTAIDVHDDEMPQACDIGFYGRPYWPQWKDKNVEIRVPPR